MTDKQSIRLWVGLLLLIGAGCIFGQTSATVAPKDSPTPDRQLQMQLTTLAEELNQVQKDFNLIDAQIRKDFPGYHLSQNLRIEKDAQPAAKNPEPAKK